MTCHSIPSRLQIVLAGHQSLTDAGLAALFKLPADVEEVELVLLQTDWQLESRRSQKAFLAHKHTPACEADRCRPCCSRHGAASLREESNYSASPLSDVVSRCQVGVECVVEARHRGCA